MLVKIVDKDGVEILTEDFAKFPEFGEVIDFNGSDYSVINIPVRHELIFKNLGHGVQWVRGPVLTVKTANKPKLDLPPNRVEKEGHIPAKKK